MDENSLKKSLIAIAKTAPNAAEVGFEAGESYAVSHLMSVVDVAAHFGWSEPKAAQIIKAAYKDNGICRQISGMWIIARHELPMLEQIAAGRKVGRPAKS